MKKKKPKSVFLFISFDFKIHTAITVAFGAGTKIGSLGYTFRSFHVIIVLLSASTFISFEYEKKNGKDWKIEKNKKMRNKCGYGSGYIGINVRTDCVEESIVFTS